MSTDTKSEATTPQTAAQINLNQTGQVTTAAFPPTVNITPNRKNTTAKGWSGGTLKGTRDSVLKAISESALTDAQKALLIEEIGLIASEHELLRVDFHRHKHMAGANCTFTVMEL